MKRLVLHTALSAVGSHSLAEKFDDFACVALLIRTSPEGTLLGFIRRAEHPKDPWSGQIALPGGRCDPEDCSDLDAVLREVREEIGLNLSTSPQTLRLNDVQARRSGAMLPFFLRPFVFLLENDPPLQLDPLEVSAFHWISLDYLLKPQHQIDHFTLPAIRFPNGDILWGLTYVILTDFLERIHASEDARKIFLSGGDIKHWRKYQR